MVSNDKEVLQKAQRINELNPKCFCLTFGVQFIHRLKRRHNYTLKTIDKYCKILGCQPGDILLHVEEETGIEAKEM